MSHNRLILRGTWIYEPEQVIELYRPVFNEAGWYHLHRPQIERCARAVDPQTPHAAMNAMLAVSYFFRWAVDNKLSLELEDLFTPDVVEWYVSDHLARLSDMRAAQHRSMLRRIGPQVTRHALWTPRPEAFARRAIKAPYRATEVAGYLRIMEEQPTERAKRVFAVILYLSLGAGLRGPEAARVHAHHLTAHRDYVTVMVEGTSPRIVAVRREFARPLMQIARDNPEGPLVGKVRENEKDVTSKLKKILDVPVHLPRLHPSRLRTTWMATVLNEDVRLGVFLESAGINVQSLRDLAPYLTAREAPEQQYPRLAGGAL